MDNRGWRLYLLSICVSMCFTSCFVKVSASVEFTSHCACQWFIRVFGFFLQCSSFTVWLSKSFVATYCASIHINVWWELLNQIESTLMLIQKSLVAFDNNFYCFVFISLLLFPDIQRIYIIYKKSKTKQKTFPHCKNMLHRETYKSFTAF